MARQEYSILKEILEARVFHFEGDFGGKSIPF
jgi:hypothetical protein